MILILFNNCVIKYVSYIGLIPNRISYKRLFGYTNIFSLSKFLLYMKNNCTLLFYGVLLILTSSITVVGQTISADGKTATYTQNKTIGSKFRVPDSWERIVINAGVTVTGSFYSDGRSAPLTIEGVNRQTSILKGTGNFQSAGTQESRTHSGIRIEAGVNVTVKNLTSLNPDKFHTSCFGKIEVINCDLIDNRGQHTTDGVHGGVKSGSIIRGCYINTHDDAMYYSECGLIENTTIVHNKNGAPFQGGWGVTPGTGWVCVIRDCKVIDASSETGGAANNNGYNQGVVSWAGKSSAFASLTVRFEGTFTRQVRSGAKRSPMYQLGRRESELNNAELKSNLCTNAQNTLLKPSGGSATLNTSGCSVTASGREAGNVLAGDVIETYTFDKNGNLLGMSTETLAVIQVRPNPASEVVSIENLKTGSQVVVYDMQGRMHMQQKVSQNNLNLNVSRFNKGLYLVVISNGTSTEKHKLVVQ